MSVGERVAISVTRRRIAVISTMGGAPWGGSEELWAAMVEEALNEGHDVFVSVYAWPETPRQIVKLRQKGARVRTRAFPKYPRLRKLIGGFASSQFAHTFSFDPDVICVNQGGAYDVAYLRDLPRMLLDSQAPYLLLCHLNYDTFVLDHDKRELAGELFKRAAGVVFVSHENLRLAERQLVRKLPHAVVLQNPLSLADVTPLAWPPAGKVALACVARLEVKQKGQDSLLETLGAATWRDREWELNFYGEGPDQTYLQALARHYGIAERVHFRGYQDVRDIWARNHLLVLPSRAEGVPLVVVEAMLYGRPAVATEVGAAAEWLAEGLTGFIAEAATIKSFGAALERAWAVKDDWPALGALAHDQALRKIDRSPGKTLLQAALDAAHTKEETFTRKPCIPRRHP